VRLILFTFGRLRSPGLREAADYYTRNIKFWVPIEEIELKPIPVPDKSPATRRKIQEKEAELLLSKVADRVTSRGLLYLLDETGKPWPTQKWADQVRTWEREGVSEVALCIGSSLGFSEAVRAKARGSLSLGPQTLSHELARVVLLEQLYRAWSVVRGHPYHNEG
jgi:23S rRNA (pseudouridine1915-N3)-methyltransferase